MCGIFGMISTRSAPASAEKAVRAILHRGPDAQGTYFDGPVALGHARLSIIDLTPTGAQPMEFAGGEVVVVYNGEIYNHHELRDELIALGRTFRGRSDTEVIGEGYLQHGPAFLERLDGMFAIALWDRRTERLILIRDRAGEKPCFYVDDADLFAFASEPKALFEVGVSSELDEQTLPFLFTFGYVPAPRTFFRRVKQLPPASVLIREKSGAVSVRRYWRPPFDQPRLDISYPDAQAEVRRLLEAAVRRRMEADVPVGAFLSGGIDSSIVVGLMARASSRPVRTFSIGFDGDARFDETDFARAAAKHFGTEHVEFRLKPSSFELVETLVESHDGPFGDHSAIPTSVVSRLTREHVTVALTGDGGDELFCGYSRFLAVEAAEHMPSGLRAVAAGAASALHLQAAGGVAARAARLLDVAKQPLSDRQMLWVSIFGDDLSRVLRPELLGRSEYEPRSWHRSTFPSAGGTKLSRILAANFESYLPYDLLVKADRCSMLHSLEVRPPFLDTALVEFAARLPDHHLRRGTSTKRVLRDAFADVLPPQIVRRGKMGFGLPVGTWFRRELRDYLRDQLQDRGLPIFAYVQYEYVQTLLAEHESGARDHGHRLWLLLTLSVWLRRHR